MFGGLPGAADGWVWCKSEYDVRPELGSLWPYTKDQKVYKCPLDWKKSMARITYSMNGNLGGKPISTARSPLLPLRSHGLKEDYRNQS